MGLQKPSPMLLLATIILVGLFFIALLTSYLTRAISQNSSKKTPDAETAVSPTPPENALFLDLPASFPRDIPLPARSHVSFQKESDDSWETVFVTVVTPEEMVKTYLIELPDAGWKITNQSQGAGLTILYIQKNKREGIMTIGKGDDGNVVSITILKR